MAICSVSKTGSTGAIAYIYKLISDCRPPYSVQMINVNKILTYLPVTYTLIIAASVSVSILAETSCIYFGKIKLVALPQHITSNKETTQILSCQNIPSGKYVTIASA